MKFLVQAISLMCVVSSCSSGDRTKTTTPTPTAAASAVVAQLARFRGIAERPRGWNSVVPLSATAPKTADGPTRIASGDAWLSITAVDLAARPAADVEGRIVFADAARATDVVEIIEPARVEDVRILRDATAKPTARYRVEHSATIAGLRARDGVIEAIDRDGVARFATERAFAIDANGTRRDVTLTVDGDIVEARLDTAGLAYPIALDPAWTALAAPPTQHSWPVIGRLANGKILHVGGYTHERVSLFDPTTKTWAVAAPLSTKRGAPVGFVFGNNAIAIAGSSVSVTAVSTSEIYDALTDSWTAGPSLPEARRNHKGVLLADGRYLITGGSTNGTSTSLLGTAWTWTPSATSFTSAGSHRPRGWHFAVRLNDGRVLVGSGANTPTVDVWTSPSTWTAAASMPFERQSAAAVVLPSGKVLVNGGTKTNSSPLVIHSSSEIYDPTTDTWTTTASSLKGHWTHQLYVLPTGKVLLIDTDAEIFDPATSTWIPAGSGVIDGQGVMLPSGELYVQGSTTAKLFVQGNNGDACSGDYECKSLFCVDGVCCDKRCGEQCNACDIAGSVGTCSAVTGAPHGTRPSCGAFVCSAGACGTTCTSDAQCASTHHCAAGACVAKKTNGGTCTANNQCTSGFCVDGVCCESACNGQCEACDVTAGTCTAVTGAPHGSRAACGGTGAGTECGAVCNGSNRTACVFPSAKPCSSNSCMGGIETHASICDGAGSCGDIPKSCGPYKCGTSSCLSSCASAADCATGFSCISNVCTAGPAPKLGDPCTDASTCPTGAACVDGVCCDRACDGQCEACDVSGSVGTCKAVAGAPHGKRAACATDATDVCRSRTCDGKDASTCAGYVSGNTCDTPTCNAALFRAASTCDGTGACKPGADTACAPFACDNKGCLTTCVENAHCAKGFVCEGKTCVPAPTATCEGNTSVSPSGARQDCAPYRCRTDGLCGMACGSTEECAPGAVCDPSTKTCTVASAPTEDGGGGCSTSSGGNAFGAALLAIALAVTLRRRAA